MVISALGRPRKKDYQRFKVSLGYVTRTKLTYGKANPISKKRNNAHNPKSLKPATTMQVSK